ncbi:MAG: FecR family protein [Spirochaetota bacterium]
MKRLILIITAITIASSFLSCNKQQEQKTGSLFTVYSVVGEVTISSKDSTRDAVNGDSLQEGDTIATGEMSLADISYGNAGIVRVKENSQFSIKLLAQKAETENVNLTVEKGSLYSIVPKLSKGSMYKVQSDTCVASVRGTSFMVSNEKKKGRIDVLSGTVSVNPVKEGKVVEEAEEQVAEGNAVELEEKDVEVIVEKKEKIAVKEIEPQQLETISNDLKTLKAPEKPVVDEEVTKEEPGKDAKKVVEVNDITKELEKVTKTLEKKKEETKDDKKEEMDKEAQKQAKLEKKRYAAREAARLKAEKEAEEKARVEQEKKQLEEKKRRGVQNVPTL